MKKLLEEFEYRGIPVKVYSRKSYTLTPETDSPITYFTTSNIHDWLVYSKTPEAAIQAGKNFIDRFLDQEINTIEDLARAIEKYLDPHEDHHLDMKPDALRILVNKYMDSSSPKDLEPVIPKKDVRAEVGCGTALKRYMDEKGLTMEYLEIECYYPEDDESEIYCLITDKASVDFDISEDQELFLETYVEILDRDTNLINMGYAEFTNGESASLTPPSTWRLDKKEN